MSQIQENAERMREIADEMYGLLNEAQDIARHTDNIFYENKKAYIFDQLSEHISNGNPYNQSLNSLADEMERLAEEDVEEEDEEDVEEDKVEDEA